jgi:uncharacterized secreted protein with C-terminal beta-propeller domain
VLYLAVACLVAAATLTGISVYAAETNSGTATVISGHAISEPRTFSSYEELERYVRENTALAREFYGYHFFLPGVGGILSDGRVRAAKEPAPGVAAQAAEAPSDYSGTNVQVQGVDEADVVKTDGRFLYVLTGGKVAIVRAHPPEQARVVSELACEGRPLEAFVNGDRLVVFAAGPQEGRTAIRVYDVGDRSAPVLKRDLGVRGSYVTSRMIDDYVYVILSLPLEAGPGEEKIALPEWSVDGQVRVVSPTRIHYFAFPDHSYRYTTILALNVRDDAAAPTEKTFLTGVSQHLYASRQHVYLTGPRTPDLTPLLRGFLDRLAELVPEELRKEVKRIRDAEVGGGRKLLEVGALLEDYLATLDPQAAADLAGRIEALRAEWHRELARQGDRTVIHKLGVAGADIEYLGQGEVPGRLLNQFSMDEYGGHFRIATTTEGFLFPERPATRNNIFVLDENLQVVGKLTGLALSERIYAARFVGERAYLVTFRRVDPLFVIDLHDPRQPRVLGELKIPGYSDYLHPYDDNHLIGIGREVTEAPGPEQQGPFTVPPPVRDLGIKIALFDVSDPAAPREMAKYVLENPLSYSPALQDHRAVLFSREKNLLVIPVSLHPPFHIMAVPGKVAPEGRWEGAYVFDISLAEGIRLKGRIAHYGESAWGPANVPARDSSYPVRRTLYIEDTLYTVSESLVKMHRLSDLREAGYVSLTSVPVPPAAEE